MTSQPLRVKRKGQTYINGNIIERFIQKKYKTILNTNIFKNLELLTLTIPTKPLTENKKKFN